MKILSPRTLPLGALPRNLETESSETSLDPDPSLLSVKKTQSIFCIRKPVAATFSRPKNMIGHVESHLTLTTSRHQSSSMVDFNFYSLQLDPSISICSIKF